MSFDWFRVGFARGTADRSGAASSRHSVREPTTASRARPALAAMLAAAAIALSSAPIAYGAAPDPQTVVQSFYDWYIAEAEAGRPLTLRGRPDLTPAFVDWAEHYNDGQMFGANPILCAQDIPPSVTAGPAAISGSQATVTVTEAFAEPYRITVGLTLGVTGWQISRGGCAQASTAVRRPDGRVRLATYGSPGRAARSFGRPFVGNNVYNRTGAGQAATMENFNEVDGAFYTFDISIQNDGTRSDRFRVQATGTPTRWWKVEYFSGTRNITSAVVAGTYRTGSLAPGTATLIRARITLIGSADLRRLVTIRSLADPTKADVVRFGYKQVPCGC